MFEFAAGTIAWLNNSPIFAAVASVIFNYGSRFVLNDLTPKQEELLTHRVTRKILVLCMFFVVTRDVMLSVILTVVFMFFANVLLNENNDMSVFNTILGRRGEVGQWRPPSPPPPSEEGETEEKEKEKEAFTDDDIIVVEGDEEDEEDEEIEANPNPFLDAFDSASPE